MLHELVVAGRRALEDQHGTDVHVRAVVLLGQEAGVGGAEAIEVRWSHGSDPPAEAVAERWKLTAALAGVKGTGPAHPGQKDYPHSCGMAGDSADKLSLLERDIDTFNRHDVEEWVNLFHPDARMVPSPYWAPPGTVYHGRAGARSYAHEVFSRIPRARAVPPETLREVGDLAVGEVMMFSDAEAADDARPIHCSVLVPGRPDLHHGGLHERGRRARGSPVAVGDDVRPLVPEHDRSRLAE